MLIVRVIIFYVRIICINMPYTVLNNSQISLYEVCVIRTILLRWK
jgi:hypothetical protein